VLAGCGTLAVAAAYAVMGVAPSLALACAGAVVGGVGNGVQWVAVASLVQRRAPAAAGWRVTAVLESIAVLAPGAGFLLGGVAATAFDPRTCMLAISAAIAAVALVAGYAALPRRRAGMPAVSWIDVAYRRQSSTLARDSRATAR
jgi:MFS family permease